MKIEQLKIKNYRALKDIEIKNIPNLAIFVGANGVGKSTLFDVFAFLRDALNENVHAALAKRGGFAQVVSRGGAARIIFEIKFRVVQEGNNKSPLVTYHLEIGQERGRGIVEREVLKYRRGQHGKPWHFLDFTRGEGSAVLNELEYGTPNIEIKREEQKLNSPDILAIKGLGQFQRFEVVSAFRKLIEQWHLSNFKIDSARPTIEDGYAEHLSSRGDNLAQVTQFLYENHPEKFAQVLKQMTSRVPGISNVEATSTVDGRLVLRFQDGTFKDPFIARHVSDGTIKMFAYLILLNDPRPHPLLCIEEPENQLYPTLLLELVEEFREYGRRGGQVMVSTHSPDLLNGAELDEVFWLEKHNGFTQIKRASEDPLIRALVAEGDQLGALWKQNIFGEVDP